MFLPTLSMSTELAGIRGNYFSFSFKWCKTRSFAPSALCHMHVSPPCKNRAKQRLKATFSCYKCMFNNNHSLQNSALVLPPSRPTLLKWRASGCVKYVTYAVTCFCRALDVGSCPDAACQLLSILWLYMTKLALCALVVNELGVTKVLFSANQHNGYFGAVVFDLRHPLIGDVVETVWILQWEAQQYDVSVWIRQRPVNIKN